MTEMDTLKCVNSERVYFAEKELIRHNAGIVRDMAKGHNVIAVVKGDGYGLGIEKMVKLFLSCGISDFAVSESWEAERVRELCPNGMVLLMRPVSEISVESLVLKNITFSVGSAAEHRLLKSAAARLGATAYAHIKIDTGFGRYGFLPSEFGKIISAYSNSGNVKFNGIYTHFSSPTENCLYTECQFERFKDVLEKLKTCGVDVGLRHCCASNAMLIYDNMQMDAVRVGSAFLGRVPYAERYGLQKVGYAVGVVEHIKTVRKGTPVGYGGRFKADREVTVAVCNMGYINGFGVERISGKEKKAVGIRSLFREKPYALSGIVNGQRVYAVGSIGMSSAEFDVTNQKCRVGDAITFDINPLMKRGMKTVFI